MLAPDELSAKAVIPTIRAMVARKLVNEHSMTQQRVASLLGLTQAAVSNYVRQKRGSEFHLDDVDEVNKMVDSMVVELSNGDPRPQVVLKRLTEAGNHVKSNLLMCKWHRELEPTLDLDGCRICATVR